MNKTTTLLCTAALIAVAGCTKKPPAKLPPAPSQTVTTPETTTTTNTQTNGVTPGSRADFLNQAGSDTVHFATDSSDIDSEATAILTKQATWLQKFPNVRVTVEGHCDERGTREYNLALGDRRANSAKNFLVNAGVNPARISVISYGKERPVATGSDEDSWAQNRRAVSVVPQ
ncbi:MAG TPA: peptidoglycan-associated lipoprotein Pal [Sphingomonas sp.]|uniref:peptidoglycan-associated lipoprotein Pal n=1 Tax=Sphingomonas sp. TaxID=28214 RepID=UPI002C3CAF97|nr:peptidoglycan-associated lipoprotein Pal [Sphingomonas sp.]HMI18686.1 peptidoglycan-associated lipoprotein Pal [Sphingomonas sp.]